MQEYLKETYYYNFSHPTIQNILSRFKKTDSTKDQAIALYLYVRDGWKYNPYSLKISQNDFRASEIIPRSQGHCLDKSIILITFLRGLGIPARIHLAKVKNHIGVERIIERLGTDELAPHGFVEVWLNEKWVACTPAFNKSLCEKLKVDVLEFDGENDSVFQPYNQTGTKFMEYLEDYGSFPDFPHEFVMKKLAEQYPNLKKFQER